MSQQTRVQTVRERMPRFFDAYPSLEALAGSRVDDVLKAWEGLGYYSRARSLHRTAKLLLDRARESGRPATLPSTAAELRELPGIGPYTAGAVASMAFGQSEPAVDGNARRVLSRLFDLESPRPAMLSERARLLIAAAQERDGTRAAEVNQAIMDLGGAVCTPRRPRCKACPLEDHCLAHDRGTIALRPPRPSRRPIPHVEVAVAIIRRDDGKIFIQRRPLDGLLGGMWEFPGGKIREGETAEEAAVRETLEETGMTIRVRGPAGTVEHAYSHFTVSIRAFHALGRAGEPGGEPSVAAETPGPGVNPRAWVTVGELSDFAMPAANRKLMEAAGLGAAAVQPK